MKNFMLTVSDAGAAGGLALGLTNIYNLLGIILVIVNLGILIFNFVCRMRDRMKDGKFTNEEFILAIEDIINNCSTVKEIKESITWNYVS